MMKIDNLESYDRFVDAVKLHLIMWRRSGNKDFAEIAMKLGISERTARRRYNQPGSLTLDEFYAWCELYGKEPADVISAAGRRAPEKKPETAE